jgi:hypothetical protein
MGSVLDGFSLRREPRRAGVDVGQASELHLIRNNRQTLWLSRFQLGWLVAGCLGGAIWAFALKANTLTAMAILVSGLVAFTGATFVRRDSARQAIQNAQRRQFSLSGMLGYTAVLAILLSLPGWLGQFGQTSVVAIAGLICIVALSGWIAYGLWIVLGRRKVVLLVVAGVVIVVFLPAILAVTESLLIGSHRVEGLFRAVGLHQTLDDIYDGIAELLKVY